MTGPGGVASLNGLPVTLGTGSLVATGATSNSASFKMKKEEVQKAGKYSPLKKKTPPNYRETNQPVKHLHSRSTKIPPDAYIYITVLGYVPSSP